MKKFQFRLHSLVRLREAARDERRAQLAEALRIVASLEEEMRQLRSKLDEARQMHTAPQGAVDIDRLLVAERYEMVLLLEKSKFEQQLASMNAEVEKRRQALVWADQDVRVLEKLKETQFQRWRAGAERDALDHLDEIAGRLRPQETAL
jgi:flagellar export protein FliJ